MITIITYAALVVIPFTTMALLISYPARSSYNAYRKGVRQGILGELPNKLPRSSESYGRGYSAGLNLRGTKAGQEIIKQWQEYDAK